MLDTNCKAVAILTRDVAAGMVKRDYVRVLSPCMWHCYSQSMQSGPCHAHLATLRDMANVQGHIINISSIAATDHYAGGSIYCGTKAFVTAFTDSLRHDLVGTNIRCELLHCLMHSSSTASSNHRVL